jgi:hypothetical protein
MKLSEWLDAVEKRAGEATELCEGRESMTLYSLAVARTDISRLARLVRALMAERESNTQHLGTYCGCRYCDAQRRIIAEIEGEL